jgi:hypothetical protein
MTTDDTRPRTEAGRQLLAKVNQPFSPPIGVLLPEEVVAIEAEARAQGALHAHLVNEGDIERALDAERARHAALVAAARRVLEYGHIRPFADAAREELRAALDGEPR